MSGWPFVVKKAVRAVGPGNDGVCRSGCPEDEEIGSVEQLSALRLELGGGGGEDIEETFDWIVRRCRPLEEAQSASVALDDEVGEGAARVDG